MKFSQTPLKGAFIIESEKKEDERGSFARTFCKNEFEHYNLKNNFVQCNISYNNKKATLRGMHYQIEPYPEVKLVRCIRGAMYDVIVDIRKDSATYCKWFGIELNEKNNLSLYIPEGFAHGFITLEDNTDIFYQMGEFFHPECSSGFRWNDHKINIKWPLNPSIISEKDIMLNFWIV